MLAWVGIICPEKNQMPWMAYEKKCQYMFPYQHSNP